MATVLLRSPLRDLADGHREIRASGTSVTEVLRALEDAHPRIRGWVLDERGQVRANVAVFVNGERVRDDVAVGSEDRIQVLPSISGGKA